MDLGGQLEKPHHLADPAPGDPKFPGDICLGLYKRVGKEVLVTLGLPDGTFIGLWRLDRRISDPDELPPVPNFSIYFKLLPPRYICAVNGW